MWQKLRMWQKVPNSLPRWAWSVELTIGGSWQRLTGLEALSLLTAFKYYHLDHLVVITWWYRTNTNVQVLRNTSLQWSVDSINLTSFEDWVWACWTWWSSVVWSPSGAVLQVWLCIWFCSEFWFPRLIRIQFFIEAQIIKRREDWCGPGLWPFWLMHSYYVVHPTLQCTAYYLTSLQCTAYYLKSLQCSAFN